MARIPILSEGKIVEIESSDQGDLEFIGRYWQAGVSAFLDTGDTERLAPFEGYSVAGLPLETDPDAIEDFAYANPGFDPGELYEP
jgi:hypothetical protein